MIEALLTGKKNSDPYSSQVTLLMPMDGEHNGKVTQDKKGHAVALEGNAVITTADSAFGGSSAYFPGSVGDVMVVEDHNNLAFYTEPFTVELYVKRYGNQAAIAGLYYQRANNNFVLCLYNNQLGFWSGGFKVLDPAVFPDNEWVHVALTRDAFSKMYLFTAGKLVSTMEGDSSSYPFNSGPLYIGGAPAIYNQPFKGLIDDVRVTKGACRYTADFNPPIKSYA